jgi:hypothetical protein
MQRPVRLAVIVGAAVLGLARLSAQPVPDQRLEGLLKDSRIWGTHFGEVLAAMPTWNDAGEQQVVVYRSRVEGAREFSSVAAARQMETQTRAAFKKAQQWKLRPSFVDLLAPLMGRPVVTRNAAQVKTPDGEVRLAWGGTRQLLAADLTKAKLTDAQGQPERITRRVVPTDDERRPVVLTELHYANGTVVFSQPDYAPRPGFIDRAVLNTGRITQVVFTK